MDRKRPLWMWLVAPLVAVMGLYVASFGPACWLMARAGYRESTVFNRTFWPIGWSAARVSSFMLFMDYGTIGLPRGSEIFLPSDPNCDTGWVFGKKATGYWHVR